MKKHSLVVRRSPRSQSSILDSRFSILYPQTSILPCSRDQHAFKQFDPVARGVLRQKADLSGQQTAFTGVVDFRGSQLELRIAQDLTSMPAGARRHARWDAAHDHGESNSKILRAVDRQFIGRLFGELPKLDIKSVKLHRPARQKSAASHHRSRSTEPAGVRHPRAQVSHGD